MKTHSARSVEDVPRCVTAALYVGGEKVPLDSCSVLLETQDGVREISSWKQLDEHAVTVRVVPKGLEKHWKHFGASTWVGQTSAVLGKGRNGRKRDTNGPRGWDGENAVAVAMTRAQNGTTASRSALLAAISTGCMDKKDLQALALSRQASLRLAALPQAEFTQEQLGYLARCSEPHLRIIAAAGLRDVKARKRLLSDPDALVRGALCRNEWMTEAELTALQGDDVLALDIAGNLNAPATILMASVLGGEMASQIAIRHHRMAVMANAAIATQTVLAGHAAANPGVDMKIAIAAAMTSEDVARGLASNAPALMRMSSADATALVRRMADLGSIDGVVRVARYTTLSAVDQAALVAEPGIAHAVMIGLAGNDAISPEIAELVLDASSVMIQADQHAALVALAGNESVPSFVLNAIDPDEYATVAARLKDNDSASGSSRDKARAKVQRVRKLHQGLIRESLVKQSAVLHTPDDERIVPQLMSSAKAPMAIVMVTPETIGSRIAVRKDSQLAAWGGEVLEARVETSGTAVWSTLTLRVNERKAKQAQGTNALLDPIGVTYHDGVQDRFALLEPLATTTGNSWTEDGGESVTEDVEGTKALVKRQARKIATPSALRTTAMALLPGSLKPAVQGTKAAATMNKIVSGEPRGADRVTAVMADLTAGPARMTLESASVSREEAVTAGQQYARLLQTSGVISEQEAGSVMAALDSIGRLAKLVKDRRHPVWQARERMRFLNGQRAVIQELLNGEESWLDDWTNLA